MNQFWKGNGTTDDPDGGTGENCLALKDFGLEDVECSGARDMTKVLCELIL
jgi:hypothetical protein